MKVWPVSKGDYSDYRVLALFASEEVAQQYADGDKDREVEAPRTVVESLPTPIQHLTLHADVYEDHVDERETSGLFYPGLDDDAPPEFSAYQTVYAWSPETAHVTVYVKGTELERVRKVYSEKKAQAIADHRVLVVAEVTKDMERLARRPAVVPVIPAMPMDGFGTVIGRAQPVDWSAYMQPLETERKADN